MAKFLTAFALCYSLVAGAQTMPRAGCVAKQAIPPDQ